MVTGPRVEFLITTLPTSSCPRRYWIPPWFYACPCIFVIIFIKFSWFYPFCSDESSSSSTQFVIALLMVNGSLARWSRSGRPSHTDEKWKVLFCPQQYWFVIVVLYDCDCVLSTMGWNYFWLNIFIFIFPYIQRITATLSETHYDWRKIEPVTRKANLIQFWCVESEFIVKN